MDAVRAIEARRSVRSYHGKAVEEDKIEILLNAANNAPKAGPFHISVVTNPDVLKEINDKALAGMKNSGNSFLVERAALPGYQPLYGAPLLLLFSAPEENIYSLANVSNAATSAIIAATSLGLGSCYAVTPTLPFAGDKTLAEKLGIPSGMKPMCGVLAGYADGNKFSAPRQEVPNISYCR